MLYKSTYLTQKPSRVGGNEGCVGDWGQQNELDFSQDAADRTFWNQHFLPSFPSSSSSGSSESKELNKKEESEEET